MPAYRYAPLAPKVADLRDEGRPSVEPVGEEVEKAEMGDVTNEPVDEVSAKAGEQTGEPEAEPVKRKRGRPRKNA